MTCEPISWETIEHPYYEKTTDWYWIVGIVGLTLAVLSFIFGNGLFGIFLIIGTLTVMLHAGRVPRIIQVTLQTNGARVGSRFFPYTQMQGFSIDEESTPAVLVLDIKNPFAKDTRLALEGVQAEHVRDFLLDHLDEKYHQPSFVEGLIHYLGF